METLGWQPDRAADVCLEVLGEKAPDVVAVLEFGATEVVPRLARTGDEVANVMHALDGGFVPAGPSGSPTRGLVNVLPTGRNFYSVDPKAIPSRSAWDIGSALADSLVARHLADTGAYPRSVGLTVWGTSAMRTQGDDLAEILAVWGGYAYGRGLDGREARADMEQSFRRIAVAAKNQDTREHDIVDSDDYFQYHGGMVAMVRHLTGTSPAAYVGDSAVPDAVRTRTLQEETHRVFRARVVNPKWVAAMQRHGYKGAFEMAATVDYLFGYDATAGVVEDWMYEQLVSTYLTDPENRAFLEKSNPWALRGMAERLLEAAERGLWAEPSPGGCRGWPSSRAAGSPPPRPRPPRPARTGRPRRGRSGTAGPRSSSSCR